MKQRSRQSKGLKTQNRVINEEKSPKELDPESGRWNWPFILTGRRYFATMPAGSAENGM